MNTTARRKQLETTLLLPSQRLEAELAPMLLELLDWGGIRHEGEMELDSLELARFLHEELGLPEAPRPWGSGERDGETIPPNAPGGVIDLIARRCAMAADHLTEMVAEKPEEVRSWHASMVDYAQPLPAPMAADLELATSTKVCTDPCEDDVANYPTRLWTWEGGIPSGKGPAMIQIAAVQALCLPIPSGPSTVPLWCQETLGRSKSLHRDKPVVIAAIPFTDCPEEQECDFNDEILLHPNGVVLNRAARLNLFRLIRAMGHQG